MRPIRSVEEVENERPKGEQLETLIGKALSAASAAGYGPYEQIDRAAMVVLSHRPHLTAIDALAAVHRVKRRRDTRGHRRVQRALEN
jgi:hypothetical protein